MPVPQLHVVVKQPKLCRNCDHNAELQTKFYFCHCACVVANSHGDRHKNRPVEIRRQCTSFAKSKVAVIDQSDYNAHFWNVKPCYLEGAMFAAAICLYTELLS